ncbi:MAG TPA: anaerobic ribonucleoside-triphosphate reductase, partial [Candidatus Bathyarchaeota archaeon]|nr:anaerobic ribonucleoside-triphosphate reductase [Candidatus Bathyarchaeota archaeon]
MEVEKPVEAADSMKCTPRVRTSRLRFEDFDPSRIEESLIREVGMSRELAAEVARVAAERIARLRPSFLSAPLIREVVNVVLLEMGLEDARRRYTRVGMPVYDVARLITWGDKENANLQHQPETIHKLAADQTFIEYALLTMPGHLADAHMSGLIHIHDLEYFAIGRPFCSGHDVRFFLRRGLVVDGEGVHTSVAGPAKHPEVAVLHAAKFLAAMQTHYAGGQGYDLFNVFLAPYMRGLSYKRIKQMAQMFIYEMSQMYVARGGQTVFSSIAVEPGVPKVVEDLPAVLPGGVVREDIVYGDFEEEANTLFRAIVDVYLEGDYIGKPFNFPKLEVKLRRGFLKEYEEEYLKVAELTAKFGTPYFLNLCPDYMPEEMHSQCCRLLFTPTGDSKDEEDFREGRMRLGSIQVVTVNLPRIAYEANGDDDLLFELLEERMYLAREVLLLKRSIVREALEGGWLPLLAMDCDGEPYLPVDR